MKVLVTGATGFVGREILTQLSQAGHQPRILARHRPDPRTHPQLADADVHAGDVTRPGSLSGALSGMDAVIHLVGIISEVGAQTFENVHTEGTRNLVAATRQAGVRRFVHMSALGTRPNAVSRYHRSKWAAEEIVRNSGLDHTIFRPSLIYGPEDQFVNRFAKIIRWSPIVPLLGRADAQFAPVSVEVAGAAFVRSLTEPRSFGQTYDLCAPERFTLREILATLMQVMGKKRLMVRIPGWLARTQARLLELLFPLLRRAPPLNRDQLIMLDEDNIGSPEPAEELFGLRQKRFREGIAWLAHDQKHK